MEAIFSITLASGSTLRRRLADRAQTDVLRHVHSMLVGMLRGQPTASKLALPSPAHIEGRADSDRYAGMSQQTRETMENLDRQMREYDNRQRGWNK